MLAPSRPANEAARLDALYAYEVLDSIPEQTLDDLTALAAYICDTPISLISLVDADRQWFKSRVGISIAETPRDVAFCGHTILDTDIFVVPDAATDARFSDNPLVTGAPHVRFYAGAPLITPDGHALGALCVMDQVPRELTEKQRSALESLSRQVVSQLELRRRTREVLASERQLMSVFENCPVALAISRWSDRTFIDVNSSFTSLLGWRRDEVVGRTVQELGIATPEASAEARTRLAAHGAVREMPLDVLTKSKELRHVLIGTELVEVARQTLAVTTFVDVTAARHAEVATRRLAAIVESSDNAIIGKDLSGMITSWNNSAERIFGYTAEEVIGTSVTRLIPPSHWGEETQILTRITNGESIEQYETVRQTKAGILLDVSLKVSPIKNAAGAVVGIAKTERDITAQKQADEVRRTTEARHRMLFEYAPDGIVIADRDSYYLDANASICRMLGYTREELIGLHASDIVAPSEVQHIDTALRTITSSTDYHREWLFRRKDGSTFPAEVMAAMMPDGNLLAMIRDVTERTRNEARMRRLVDSNAQGVMFWNAAGEITSANDAFLRIVEYTREDLAAKRINWSGITPPEHQQADWRAQQEIATNGVCTPYEKEYIRADGSRIPVLVGAASFQDSSEEGVCFVLDLTERKKLEQQLLRSQRMESIGTLAGGIAHDLNNVLAPILLSVEVLTEIVRDDEAAEFLTTLKTSAEHGASLVRQVLSFARGVQGHRIAVNPVHLMNELLKILRDTFPKSVSVRFTPARDLWTVTGDPTQLHQLLLNLCVNARDAMPTGGELAVGMENVVLDETYVAMNTDARPGPYMRITVADTGTGIPLAIQERVFEPFFTTKETGSGTGLGLSTTLAIVKSHGGFIHLYSEPGSGTKFQVYLPANTSETAADQVAIDQTLLPRGNGELILVVDDETAIRTIARATLERFGYRVIVASNGAQAVALYAQHPREISVVLTDMAMPVMDGPATIVALKAIDPDVKIIGSSGLVSDGGIAKAVGAGVLHFIPKPYTAEAILATLRQILDAAK